MTTMKASFGNDQKATIVQDPVAISNQHDFLSAKSSLTNEQRVSASLTSSQRFGANLLAVNSNQNRFPSQVVIPQERAFSALERQDSTPIEQPNTPRERH